MELLLLSLMLLPLLWEVGDGNTIQNDDQTIAGELKSLRKAMGVLTRQVMLQRLFIEERIRSEADSGIKQVRHGSEGTRNYYADTHSNMKRVASIHDHSNNIRTIGMGEFIAVLNGVEFRTRHNDYRLNMPHRTSKEWHSKEPIPFPDVPPEVKGKATVAEQIVEMREWFKAWKDQDRSVRDYTKYFKPVLCYLEGAWTTETEGKIDEPFESDRHFVDANSWFDLQEKIRFTSYTGRKDNNENFAFLPTSIRNIVNGSIPVFAQWNYRILCHPIKRDIPLNRFRVVDELHSRLPGKRTLREQSMTRAARFQLNPLDTDQWKEGVKINGLLDEIMNEIPGKDNYQGNLVDNAFGLEAQNMDSKKGTLNAGFYHRWFSVQKKGAMGGQRRHRGFADQNLFMAMTTQPKVSEMTQSSCKGGGRRKVCKSSTQRWSYAIPLEVIWMTPLNTWNPYDLEYKGETNTPTGRTVSENGRTGGQTLQTAYNGTNSKKYYLTPSSFYQGNVEIGKDPADTTKNAVGVLDKKGQLRTTRASGTRVFFPFIQRVGSLRQRYPIMPVHGQGSSVWKELEAVKDILLQSKTYGYIYPEPLDSSAPSPKEPTKPTTLQIRRAQSDTTGPHTHDLTIQPFQLEQLKKGRIMTVTSDSAAGHDHTVTIRWLKRLQKWLIISCDPKDTKRTRCWDKHDRFLDELVDELVSV